MQIYKVFNNYIIVDSGCLHLKLFKKEIYSTFLFI